MCVRKRENLHNQDISNMKLNHPSPESFLQVCIFGENFILNYWYLSILNKEVRGNKIIALFKKYTSIILYMTATTRYVNVLALLLVSTHISNSRYNYTESVLIKNYSNNSLYSDWFAKIFPSSIFICLPTFLLFH